MKSTFSAYDPGSSGLHVMSMLEAQNPPPELMMDELTIL